MPGELPNFICFHDSMEIFIFNETRKKQGIKRELFMKGRFMYLCLLLRFGNTLGLTPLGAPPSRECTCEGTSLTTKH
jgi:hypothetical protein